MPHQWYRDKRVLITGASGYVGQALARELSERGARLRRATRSAQMEPLTADEQHLLSADYAESGFWSEALEGIDIVFHLAAQTGLYAAEQDPLSDWRANVLPMLELISACHRRAVRPLVVFAGTATEVGLVDHWPAGEELPDAPLSIYDAHKLAAENYLKVACRQQRLDGVTLRLTNVYGPGRSSNPQRGVLNMMVRRALAGQPLTIYGSGEYVRDYIYIDDVVDAFLAAPPAIQRLRGQHFLIGSGEGYTVASAVRLVAELVQQLGLQPHVAVQHVEGPADPSPLEMRHFVADITRYRSLTGWTSKHDLRTGLTCLIERERAGEQGNE